MEREERARLRRKKERIRRKKLRILYRRIAVALCCILIIIVGSVILSGKKRERELKEGNTHGEWLSVFEEQGPFVQARLQEKKERESSVELLAVGDNLIHDRIYEKLEDGSGGYDFASVYTKIKDEISAADIAVVNQETILTEDMTKISSWPSFATPAQAGAALVECGFDVVLHASNHTMDKEMDMVLETLDFWRKKYPETSVLGIHESESKADDITVVESKGIKFALLNYTFGFNNRDSSEVPAYLVDVYSRDKVKKDVRAAKKVSDIVVVFYHAGKEYKDNPPASVKKEMSYLAGLGVDVTIACHPHVIQKYEMVDGEDGHQMLTYYSLGNFFSGQKRPDTILGGMAKIRFRKQADGTVAVTGYEMIPIVSHYESDFRNPCVYKLSDYTEELAAIHGVKEQEEAKGIEFNLQYLIERYETITGLKFEAETDNKEAVPEDGAASAAFYGYIWDSATRVATAFSLYWDEIIPPSERREYTPAKLPLYTKRPDMLL